MAPTHRKLVALSVYATALFISAHDAAALQSGTPVPSRVSEEFYNQCVEEHGIFLALHCSLAAVIVDPVAVDLTSFDSVAIGVTSFALSVQYNPMTQSFDPAGSGPLGIFSVGGDAPPVNPGIDTEPLRLLPSSGYAPGTPLPGSTLTFTDVNGLLTVNYELGTAISLSTEVNFFILSFRYLELVERPSDLSLTAVTYETNGPGRDYSVVSFACTTNDEMAQCGSTTPSTGISITRVPEPSAILLLSLGLAVCATARTRRRATRASGTPGRRGACP